MTKAFCSILALLFSSLSFGQSFEGKITYKVEFDIKTLNLGGFELTKEQVIEKMKKEGEYFDTVTITLKNGNYIKEDNSNLAKRIIYKPEANRIYTFQKDNEYVVITDASKHFAINVGYKDPRIEKLDSTKVINGSSCKLIRLSWDSLGDEYYYYNSETIKLNPQHFYKHNYEYLNSIIELTNSYPMEIIKTLSNFGVIKMTLISISEENIEDSLFELPNFMKAEKDYYEMVLKLTGSEVMKIKN